MKACFIAGLVASTFLSPTAHAAVGTQPAEASVTLAGDSSADFRRGEGRRGGGRADGQDNAGQRDGGDRGRNWRSRDERGSGQSRWQPQSQQPQQPVDRRGDRSGNQDQPQVREGRHNEQRGYGWRNGDQRNDDVNRDVRQNDSRGRQHDNSRDRYWDDRYDNGFDRERGTWDRNDRGYDDRYGNGWNREQGRWNDRDSNRDDRGRNDRSDRRDDRYDNRHDDNQWDSNWRNDRRYDWRGHRSQYRDHYRRPNQYYAPDRHHRYSRFSIGVTIGSGFYHQNYWLNDPWEYRLPPVHGPYRWVRYYDDVLLIDVRNGYVVDVINDFFW